MITEDYCSYEVAKLLKEKGFDIFCDRGWESIDYDKDHDVNCYPYNKPYPFNEEKRSILSVSRWMSAPTHQMAMKWLREVHKLHIDIDPSEGDWSPCVIELENWSSLTGGEIAIQDTYEEAVEAALKYSLKNLIK